MVSSSLPDEASTPYHLQVQYRHDSYHDAVGTGGIKHAQNFTRYWMRMYNPRPVSMVGTVSLSVALNEIHVYVDPEKMEALQSVGSGDHLRPGWCREQEQPPGGTFDLGTKTPTLRVEGEFKTLKRWKTW